jgi:hypothetical protein
VRVRSYAVVGVQSAFGLRPDLVSGPAANTTAAVALVQRLAGVPALNLMDRAARPALRAMLMANSRSRGTERAAGTAIGV